MGKPDDASPAYRVSIFTFLWIGWALFFVVIEGIALFRPAKGDTFSEGWWALFRSRTKSIPWYFRVLLLIPQLVLGGWLLGHLPFAIWTL